MANAADDSHGPKREAISTAGYPVYRRSQSRQSLPGTGPSGGEFTQTGLDHSFCSSPFRLGQRARIHLRSRYNDNGPGREQLRQQLVEGGLFAGEAREADVGGLFFSS